MEWVFREGKLPMVSDVLVKVIVPTMKNCSDWLLVDFLVARLEVRPLTCPSILNHQVDFNFNWSLKAASPGVGLGFVNDI